MPGMLGKVMQLKPKTYTSTDADKYRAINLPEGQQFGLIAQEVENVLPSLVGEEIHPSRRHVKKNGQIVTVEGEKLRYKSFNYVKLVPVLVQAMQEQQVQLEAQQEQIEAQQKEIDALKEALRQQGLTVE